MNQFSEIVIRLKIDGSITIEECNDGIKSFKTISPDCLLKCIDSSKLRGGVRSGLLPKNCLSFKSNDDGSKDICILHPEDKADITFLKTEYKDFPLPRLVFGFSISDEGRVSDCSLGVVENVALLKPETKMYHWPFSNVTDTKICLGNNPLPKCTGLHTLGSLPYLIMAIPNNLDHFRAVHNKTRLEMRDLLELMKNKTQSYYYKHILVPSGKTLNDFIT